MRSNSIENPARPRLALPACTERSERAPSAAEGSGARFLPALSAVEGRSERTRRAEGPRPHPALPKLNANRNTNLLAIALTRWKQRVTTLSNRHKIQFVKSASGCAHPTTPTRRERE